MWCGFVSDAVVVLCGWRRWKMGVMCPYHYEPPNRFESKITKHHVLSSPCSRPLNYQASSLEISRGLVEWLLRQTQNWLAQPLFTDHFRTLYLGIRPYGMANVGDTESPR